MPDSELYMDYAGLSRVGEAAGNAGTNLASTRDQTAPGCVAAARAYPTWATSQAVVDVHAAHVTAINGHIELINTTAAGMQGAADLMGGADNSAAQDAKGVAGQI